VTSAERGSGLAAPQPGGATGDRRAGTAGRRPAADPL